MADEDIKLLGGLSGKQEILAEAEARDIPFLKKISMSYNAQTALSGIAQKVQRETIPAAPGFDPTQDEIWNEYKTRVPKELHNELAGAGSRGEMDAIVDDYQRTEDYNQKLSRSGYSGIGASLAGGLFDIDMLAGPLGKGVTLFKPLSGAMRLKKGTRAEQVVDFAQAGAEAGAIVEGANIALRPGADIDTLPGAVAASAIVSGAFGAALPKFKADVDEINRRLPDADEELQAGGLDSVYDHAGSARHGLAPEGGDIVMTKPKVDAETGEVLGDQSLSTDELIEQAGIWRDESDFTARRDKAPTGWHEKAADAVSRFKHWMPILKETETITHRLTHSESSVLNMLAENLLEDGTGKIRKNHTAAMTQELYQHRLASESAPMAKAYQEWARAQGANALDVHWHGKGVEDFGKAVREEMTSRRIDDVELTTDANVKAAADALEARNRKGEEILKGRDGEIAVKGAEGAEFRRGYVQQKFNSIKLRKAVSEHGLKKMSAALGRKISRTLPHIPEDVTPKIAKAMLHRSMYKDANTEVSMQVLLGEDARTTLSEVLKENSNMSQGDIDRLVEKMKPVQEGEGSKGFLRKRTEVDLRGEEDGIDFMDLMDNDMVALDAQYVRQVAGSGALARQGITSRRDKERLIDAAMKEQADLGLVNQIAREDLEDIFTFFDPGPIAGGVSNTVRTVKAFTNMSLLPQLAVTQMAETGASMAQVGAANWFRNAPQAAMDLVTGKKTSETSELLDDLEYLMGDIGNEHNLFRDDLALDVSKSDANSIAENERFIHKAGLKGQRLMNWMGGFYATRAAQQRGHVASFTNKLFKALRDGDLNDPNSMASNMMADAGFSPIIQAELKKLVDNGVVEFGDGGFVNRVNSQQWDPVLSDQFSMAMYRNINQVIQKTMAGEDSLWMHRSTGSLVAHMLSFPIAAVDKQLVRNLRTNPELFYKTLMYGMATASMAYAVKQTINGKSEDLTLKSSIVGGFGMGNVTGFLPMAIDPFFYMAGADTGMTGKYGAQNPIEMFTPAALSVGQRLFDLPTVVSTKLQGEELNNSQIRALQTIPIVGKFYGINWMLNAQKDQ